MDKGYIMKNKDLLINLCSTGKSINDFLGQVQELFILENYYININIKFPQNGFVYPYHLNIIVAVINYAKLHNNIKINILQKPNKGHYISRMNFYKVLGLDDEENYIRHNRSESLIEITEVKRDEASKVVNAIMKVIQRQCILNNDVFCALNYCFMEIVDNLRHSELESGYLVLQNYSRNNKLIISVIDTGIGIPESLRQNEKYKTFTNDRLLEYSIRENITNGSGMGNGLYHTKKFIDENRGCFNIYSNGYNLKTSNGSVEVKESNYWQGTLLNLEINTNIDTSWNNIFGVDIPTTVIEADDCINGLW